MQIGGEDKINTRLEQVRIVVLKKTSSWESVPQSSDSWEEAD